MTRKHNSSRADRAMSTRADRRNYRQPLSSLGVRLDEALADALESQVFHRRPSSARTPDRPSLGRETVARQRRRRELLERTSWHGRNRIDFAELEDGDDVER